MNEKSLKIVRGRQILPFIQIEYLVFQNDFGVFDDILLPGEDFYKENAPILAASVFSEQSLDIELKLWLQLSQLFDFSFI